MPVKRWRRGPGSAAPRERRRDLEEYQELCRVRTGRLVDVREPFVLVSQIQRSGGTLLSQLFDGHPECHAHPSEVYIGYPRKNDWPFLDLSAPGTWFDQLYESPVDLHLREGYVKQKEAALDPEHDVYPFLFLPGLQRELFDHCASTRRIETERDVLDCYFTSYFNAWLDNQNLYAGPKRVVTGFTPGLSTDLSNVARFFAAYPDGTLVSIVRHPASWYESARRYRPQFEDLDGALALWAESTRAAIEAAQRFGDAVVLLTYEQLVLETEATMRLVADRVGISTAPILLEPTFNGRAIRANSSVAVDRHGIIPERTEAYRGSLPAESIERVEALGGGLYEQANAIAAESAGTGRRRVPVAAPVRAAPDPRAGSGSDGSSRKILFVMNHPAHVRSFVGVLKLLSARGHRVHLAFERIKTGDSHNVVRRLAEECPGLTFGPLPRRGSPGWVRGRHGWAELAERLRFGADYLRYFDPVYEGTPGLKARAARRTQPTVRRIARILRPLGPGAIRAFRGVLQSMERCLLPPAHVERFIVDQLPDVVLVSHLVELGSNQVEYVRAAKRLGVHTGYPVFSWDNLTNKGVVHEPPELMLVWNDLQVAEAVELHGIPRGHVRMTGACAWDHWFEWAPSMTRSEFCHELGLREDRPIVLYVCSSHFIAPDEVRFVPSWLEALRAHGGLLADAGVLVRPHPRNSKQWADVWFDDPQVTVWPRFGEEPLDEVSRQHYFDSIYHSGAVVGINTSAQIESAIVGRPVLTVLADQFGATQEGTLHFRYLKADDFGHLLVGRTLEEHAEQLETSLRDGPDTERNERFLRRFVRPLGLDVPASPLVVEGLEELAAAPAPAPVSAPVLAPAVRLALWPAAAASGRSVLRDREEKKSTPTLELQRIARRLGRDQSGSPVVAGPWLGDEITELLYWIPFVRWVQSVTFDVAERLVVVSRASSASWYAGIGSKGLTVDELGGDTSIAAVKRAVGAGDVMVVPTDLVETYRAELAARRPGERSMNRLLDFERLDVPGLPPGVDLPDRFVAVRFAYGDSFPRTGANLELAVATIGTFAESEPVVVIAPPPELAEELARGDDDAVRIVDTPDRGVAAAVAALASAFVGSYGTTAYLAALSGVPAVAFHAGAGSVRADDLKLAASFLLPPAFGSLHTVEVGAPEAVDQAVELIRAAVEPRRPTEVG